MPSRLKALKVTKVALVDQGANPDAHIVLFKRDQTLARGTPPRAKKRRLTKIDGDEPLTTDEILTRQREQERLWREWWEVQDAFRTSIESIGRNAEEAERPLLLRQSIEEFVARAVPLLEAMGMVEKAQPLLDDIQAVAKGRKKKHTTAMKHLSGALLTLENILRTEETMATVDHTALEKQLAELTQQVEGLQTEKAELAKRNQALEEEAAKQRESDDPAAKRQAALAKMDPETRALFEEQEVIQKAHAERIEKAEAEAQREREVRQKQEAITKARTYTALPINPDDHYSIFMKLDNAIALDSEDRDKLYTILKSANEMAVQAGIFQERGSGGDDLNTNDTAEAQVQKMARQKIEKNADLSLNDAIAEVMRDEPTLYAQYRRETQTKV